MSRNSKGARLTAQRKQVSAQRRNGNKGPKQTTPAHGKRRENCLWYKYHNNIKTAKRQRDDDVAAPVVITTHKPKVPHEPPKFKKLVPTVE